LFTSKIVKDPVILVQGASSGLGRLIALKYAKIGAKVMCTGRKK
jgi:NADP-dependent 3-hydroxy acid dehydrogenase YdfG